MPMTTGLPFSAFAVSMLLSEIGAEIRLFSSAVSSPVSHRHPPMMMTMMMMALACCTVLSGFFFSSRHDHWAGNVWPGLGLGLNLRCAGVAFGRSGVRVFGSGPRLCTGRSFQSKDYSATASLRGSISGEDEKEKKKRGTK